MIIKVAEKIPHFLHSPGRIFATEDMKRAAEHHSVDPGGISVAAALLSTLASAGLSLLAYLITVNFVLAVALHVSSTSAIFFLISNHLHGKLMSEEEAILASASQVIEELYYGVTYTSIFDALRSTVTMNRPIISEAMERSLRRIVNGMSPELALVKYLRAQPSESFRRGMLRVLHASSDRPTEHVEDFIRLPDDEVKGIYREASSQLETRIAIFMAFGLFSPLILATAVGLMGIPLTPLLYIYLPAHTMLLTLIHRYLVRPRQVGLGGEW